MLLPVAATLFKPKKISTITCTCLISLLLVFISYSALAGVPLSQERNSNQNSGFQPGVIVESIDQHSETEKAGLQVGDVLVSWSRGESKGEIQSPFDLFEIELEQAPRGTVILAGMRRAEQRTWALGPGSWQAHTRPNFSGQSLVVYERGVELAKGGKLDQAASQWRAIKEVINAEAAPWIQPWLLFRLAEALENTQQWDAAANTYQEALAAASGRARVFILHALGQMFFNRADWKNSAKYYQQALTEGQADSESFSSVSTLTMLGIAVSNLNDLNTAENDCQQALAMARKLVPESLAEAQSLECLGNVADDREQSNIALERLRQSLEIREKLVPNSKLVADSLHNLGSLAGSNDPALARDYQRQALELYNQLGSDSVRIASTLISIGNANRALGDLDAAEDCYRRALILFEKSSPTRRGVAVSLDNLGRVSELKGNFVQAEEFFQRALAIDKLPQDKAFTLTDLGGVALERSDFDKAEEYYQQALALREKWLPNSFDYAGGLGNLGQLALDRGNDLKAESYFRQSLAIVEKQAPESSGMVWLCTQLGVVARNRRNLKEAEANYRKALAIASKVAPMGPIIVEVLSGLGDVALDNGELEKAEEYYHQTLSIIEKSAPAGWRRATILAGLASIARARNQVEKATELYQQAVDALEEQTLRIGGAEEVRAYFRSRNARFYKDYIDLLVQQGHAERAFELSERLHARSLLETLAIAHLDIRKGADPVLLDRERSLAAEIEIKSERRGQLISASGSKQQIVALEKEIAQLTGLRKDLEARIRDGSPVFAALTHPQPLSAREVQQKLLDPDTNLLEYSLGEERSYAFLLTRDSVRAFELPARAVIEKTARRAYQLLTVRGKTIKGETMAVRQRRWASAQAQYASTAAELSRMILWPMTARIKAKRLLVVSDGALEYIPFSVLPASRRRPWPLVVEQEIVNLPSASVLAMLRHAGSERKVPSNSVAVLADPVFSSQDSRVARVRSANLAGSTSRDVGSSLSVAPLANATRDAGLLSLRRLAFSRQEAEAIAALASTQTALMALDFKASRRMAMSPELGHYRIVHFATHGMINSEHPEFSGLVFSLVDESGNPQNGFMTLDDIYNLEWPADLVVLSACETALGKDIRGEGLVGLTQGFMYAGTSRVMASLWSVDDAATAVFMAKLYKSMLQNGLSPSAALRKTQMQMRKEKRWRDPYYWGAFTIQGEWAPAKEATSVAGGSRP